MADADGKTRTSDRSEGRVVCAVFLSSQRRRPAPNRRIIFSSNNGDPRGREFDLWAISNSDGSQLEQITDAPDFNFPIFSPRRQTLAFFRPTEAAVARRNQRLWRTGLRRKLKTQSRSLPVKSRRAFAGWPRQRTRRPSIGTKGIQSASDELARAGLNAGLRPAGEPVAGRPFLLPKPVEVVVGVRDAGSSFRDRRHGARALTGEALPLR